MSGRRYIHCSKDDFEEKFPDLYEEYECEELTCSTDFGDGLNMIVEKVKNNLGYPTVEVYLDKRFFHVLYVTLQSQCRKSIDDFYRSQKNVFMKRFHHVSETEEKYAKDSVIVQSVVSRSVYPKTRYSRFFREAFELKYIYELKDYFDWVMTNMGHVEEEDFGNNELEHLERKRVLYDLISTFTYHYNQKKTKKSTFSLFITLRKGMMLSSIAPKCGGIVTVEFPSDVDPSNWDFKTHHKMKFQVSSQRYLINFRTNDEMNVNAREYNFLIMTADGDEYVNEIISENETMKGVGEFIEKKGLGRYFGDRSSAGYYLAFESFRTVMREVKKLVKNSR